MDALSQSERENSLETDRLLLRPFRVPDAVVLRELWGERDPRVPPHRRIDSDGRPSIGDIEDQIRSRSHQPGLLAVERKGSHDVIGYCGLIRLSTDLTESLNWHSNFSVGHGVRDMRLRPHGR